MPNKPQPTAKAEMLIRKPVAEVFEAFVNPAVTSKFWFSKGSGRLEAGQEVRLDWAMYVRGVWGRPTHYAFDEMRILSDVAAGVQ